MSPMDRTRYPDNWEQIVAGALVRARSRCQGCGVVHREDGTNGTVLTVHHPDRDPENRDARLTVLCARCHLSVEQHARRRERIAATRQPGESMTDAWRRAQLGITVGQLTMEEATRAD